MEKINIGIIGLGQRGQGNLSTVMIFDDINIVMVCDTYEDRIQDALQKVTDAGRPAPIGTTDYHDILNNEEVNTVLIFSSWESHVKISIEAMLAGKAVGMVLFSVLYGATPPYFQSN